MTRQLNHITIHRIDEDNPPCLRTLKRWVRSIPQQPPRLSWAGLFGVKHE